jgi:dUTPase
MKEKNMNETPIYKFALRNDVEDDKRFLPTRAEPKASGWDVRACQADRKPIVLEPFQYVKIPLGFRAFCPEGWWFEMRPRSSTFAKKYLHSLYGVIDETWEGECIFACEYQPELKFINDNTTYEHQATRLLDKSAYSTLTINYLDAIGQIIPVRRQEMMVEELSNEQYNMACKERGGIRGVGGFGSTSK